MSLLIAAVIVLGTWRLLRQSLHLLFDGVPAHIDLAAVHRCLLALPGVTEVHDLHVWALGTSQPALTAHLVLHSAIIDTTDTADLLARASQELQAVFRIGHATLQLEPPAFAAHCALRGNRQCA